MPAPVSVRTDYSARELRRLAATTKNANQSRRLLSLAAILDGMSRTDAARIGGIAVRCDVADAESGATALAEAREKHGIARILVNCAGIGPASVRPCVGGPRSGAPRPRRGRHEHRPG